MNVIITFRDPPPQTSSPTQPSTPVRTSLDKHVSARADFSVTSNFQTAESGPQPFEAEPQPTKDILVRARELKTLGSRAQPESAPHPSECEPQKKDILIRARELGIKIWTRESTLLIWQANTRIQTDPKIPPNDCRRPRLTQPASGDQPVTPFCRPAG